MIEKCVLQKPNWRKSKKYKYNIGFGVQIFLLISICVLHALPAGHYADFYPINGTFQNFNPIRRLLNGQIPYVDFVDYLGMGHLYCGSVATLFFGGDYQGSLIAFSFLTFFSLGMFCYVIGKAILRGNSYIALCITNVFLIILLIQPFFFSNGLVLTQEIKDALNYALGTGNSARFIRGLVLPVAVLLFEVVYKINYSKLIHGRLSNYYGTIGIGILAGFCFSWSNDYGISAWVSLAIVLFTVWIARTRSFFCSIKHLLIELVISFLSIFILIELFTLVQFKEWVQYTFGNGGYQGWYYNSAKSYYLFEIDTSFIILLQGIIGVVYLYFLIREKGGSYGISRYGIPAFLNIASFCAVNEYKILSGGGE